MDNDSDSEDLPDSTPTGAYTIYIPMFLDDNHQSQRPLSNLNADLLQKDWLTPDLVSKRDRRLLSNQRSDFKHHGWRQCKRPQDFQGKGCKTI
jgi:hypothetical protein